MKRNNGQNGECSQTVDVGPVFRFGQGSPIAVSDQIRVIAELCPALSMQMVSVGVANSGTVQK